MAVYILNNYRIPFILKPSPTKGQALPVTSFFLQAKFGLLWRYLSIILILVVFLLFFTSLFVIFLSFDDLIINGSHHSLDFAPEVKFVNFNL